jgi:hypothetical protein
MAFKVFPGLALLSFGMLAGLLLTGGGLGGTWERAKASAGVSSAPTAFVEPSAGGGHVLYLLDHSQRTLTVYQYDPGKGKLKLSASRHIGADQQLLEFNNEEPHVADIERLSRSVK